MGAVLLYGGNGAVDTSRAALHLLMTSGPGIGSLFAIKMIILSGF